MTSIRRLLGFAGEEAGGLLDQPTEGLRFALARSLADRAKHFYALAQKTLPPEDRKAMVAAELMGSVYWQLLQKLERGRFNVFGPQPLKLSKPHKLALIFKSWLRHAAGSTSPSYGQF